VLDAASLRASGTSPWAIAHHYDISDEFFALWLGEDMVYSCALWESATAEHSLAAAQRRKLDFFATALDVRGRRVLDIGCGWGALLDRFAAEHDLKSGVGLTLSEAQAAYARRRRVPNVEFRLENWVDHRPAAPYDAITCIEATEHLASDRLSPDQKVDVYRAFFERCAGWLHEEGRLGLQLICLDNVGHDGSRAGRGAASELIRLDIFPESMPASLSELALAWETDFEVEVFLEHHDHYRRTFRAWALAYRAAEDRARALIGERTARTFARYFAAGEAFFRLREDALYRVILRKRASPKVWTLRFMPSDFERSSELSSNASSGASAAAVQYHYDISDDFYALWLGPTMMYSSGLWCGAADDPADLNAAVVRKIDFFAESVLPARPGALLDVGCGWGGNLRRLVEKHRIDRAVGLTLSAAQQRFLVSQPVARTDVRLESWTDHAPERPYDAIVSYGAFEHFARDGTTSVQRVDAYRRFFASCFDWLTPDGRLGIETITHDGAPDTISPLGRGPLGDSVLELYPESICPHLCEIILGFEPYFEVEVLRCDGRDFARTCRLWHMALRENAERAVALVGADTVRRFQRYLASSELQFRTRLLTNTRLVLHRRPQRRW
jgi:cyclopropane-fatty-acyl-phospholipid synthase